MRQKKQSNKTIKGLVLTPRPNDNQKVLLSKHLDGCRFIYKICFKCGERHSEMKDVTKRTLECKCGNIIDRDYNSALNLLKFGETVVYNNTYQTLGKGLSEYKTFKCS